jgi:hypothetical protein
MATLALLWLSDDLPPNSESRVLGIVLRHLRRTTTWKVLLSYADPNAGHVGTIYQATGWTYLGETPGEHYVRLVDGQLHHPRSVYNRYGSNNIAHLRATGVPARRESVGGKHRYAYVLDPTWTWRLRAIQQQGLPRPRPPPDWVPETLSLTRENDPIMAAIHGRVRRRMKMLTSPEIVPVDDAPPPRCICMASSMTTYRYARYDRKVAKIIDVPVEILGESMARFAQVVVPITQPHAADA